MKKIGIILIIIMMLSAMTAIVAIADETEIEFDEMLDSIIPDASIWGISADSLKEAYVADYKECQVDGDEGWYVTDVEVSSYSMDVYYVFGEAGLSKIAYILKDNDERSKSELDQCYQTLVEEMKEIAGEPDSEKKNTSIWKKEEYKIELGKGKLKKYTGSDKATVAIVFKKGSVAKSTKAPKPASSPKPVYGRLDYKGVSRYPDQYDGQYVQFLGIIVQAQETYGVEYEGGSLLDEYYVLRVASKYQKYKTIDGYDTDDIVYVVVPKSKVEGGRILDDDMVEVFGRYDGIETYETILGGRVSIPRVEADRVVIH